jgi:hypothetical protein
MNRGPGGESNATRTLRSDAGFMRRMAAAPTTWNRVLAILKREGVMLESCHGPVPNLVEFIAGEPVKGNWWSHPLSHTIFALTRSVRDSPDVLTCRLVNGHVTFVHRRVWPALVRLANQFPPDRLAAIQELHTRTGAHKVITRPFPGWVPNHVMTAGRRLSAEQAVSSLGICASAVASTGADP